MLRMVTEIKNLYAKLHKKAKEKCELGLGNLETESYPLVSD